MKEIFAVIIDKDPTSNEVTKQILDDNSKINTVEQFLKLDEGYDCVCAKKPDLVFVDISYGEDNVFDTVSKIKKNNQSCKVVLLLKDINSQSLIKAMKAGVDETLQKPIFKKDLDVLLTKLINEINYKSTDVCKKIISVFSNKGGIGKTTIASNLAIEISELTGAPTVIVDFNSQFGDVSTFLNVSTDFGISYMINNKSKITKEFLLSMLPKYKDSNLYVLSDLFYLNDVKDLTLENVQDIIDALKSAFEYIVIDMINVFDLKTVKILDNSDEILFPLVANIPNLKNAKRCLDLFNKIGYEEEKIKLIVNRVSGTDEITNEAIESTLGKKIYAKLINDYFIVMAAINRGVGISNIQVDSDIAKSFQNLALSLVKKEEE